ncbi:STAS domain-containing protein [Nocardia sp. NPDC049149]|uniref:STAS domain-containing protein n=1 Tax=Nocardia sp. NPDC049149 TaxID=3364315 RepID=UPI003722AC3E
MPCTACRRRNRVGGKDRSSRESRGGRLRSNSVSLQTYSSSAPPGLRCVGQVDLTTRDAWKTALAGLPDANREIHLDLSELSFIDSHGTLLLVAAARAGSGERRFVLHNPPEMMLRILARFWPSMPKVEVHRT